MKKAFIVKQESLKSGDLKSTDFDKKDKNIRRIQLHATTGYSVSRKSTLTNQAMADNSNRADHYRNEAVTIKLDGYIADASLIDAPLDPEGNVIDGFDGLNLNLNTYIGGSRSTSEEYLLDIKRLQEEKRLVSVILPTVGMYSNCMITHFAPKRDTNTGLGIRVTLDLQQVIVASIGDTVVVNDNFKDLSTEEVNSGVGSSFEVPPEKTELYVAQGNREIVNNPVPATGTDSVVTPPTETEITLKVGL